MDVIQNPPTLSVVMITYGHEDFIRQAVEGVLMQECCFRVELIVADDCSPDCTSQVIHEILKTHPRSSWIRYTRHPKNKGMASNFIWALSEAKGKYIALCEGDDYWTDPLKLQRQFDFLEAHSDFSMCWHPVEVISEGEERPFPYAESKEEADIHDIILNHFIPTSSLMYRNGIISEWPEWIYKAMSFDIVLEMLLATSGKAKRLSESMAIYRQHQGGISKSPEHQRKGALRQLFILREFNRFTNGVFCDSVKKKMQDITAYQLKLKTIKKKSSWLLRLQLFRYRLFAVDANSFRDFRHEAYTHLFPSLYQKLKGR